MKHRTRFTSRPVAFLSFVAIQLLSPTMPANATHAAAVVTSFEVSTVRWRAVAVPAGAVPVDQSLTITWTNERGSAYQIIEIVNAGTVDLNHITFQATVARTSGGNDKLNDVTFEACIGGTWTALHSCSGTIQNIGTTSSLLTTTVSQPLAIATRLSVKASTSPSGANQHLTTVTIIVDSTNIRPGRSTST